MSARATTGDCLISTYVLSAFATAVGDNKCFTYLLPNPVGATSFEKTPQACEVLGLQVLWDVAPMELSPGQVLGTGGFQIDMMTIVEMDTNVIIKNNTGATSSLVGRQSLLASPTAICTRAKHFIAATNLLTSGVGGLDGYNQWDSDAWFIKAGHPLDARDGDLLCTPNFIVHFYFATLAAGVTPGLLNTPAPILRLFWKPKKLSIQKFLETQASQARQLVTTAS